ncbi:MAG: protein-L-isoaspartate(D-aspartate) O-methyltransferase [Anaerolineaceae bacterium]|nr:protein-L-isoaspartate(D-aspartate) O-methyltransferase [Anaerolineaceae bacterium]
MVINQIAGRGVRDPRVLEAMRQVPRHLFLPEDARTYAYVDSPLRIGCEQTISQPYVVALMTELLDLSASDKVLEVGTGSGYQAAILSLLVREVHSIERIPELAEAAGETLTALGYDNVQVHIGDGTEGLIEAAPYDRILVAAAAPEVPPPLMAQLAEGGRLVIPVGSRTLQQLEIWDLENGEFKQAKSIPVVFVPLIGEDGWR